MPKVKIHNLKHTFSQRLRVVDVNYESRQNFLKHRSGRITTHYLADKLHNLIEAANKVCDHSRQGAVLTLLHTNNKLFD